MVVLDCVQDMMAGARDTSAVMNE
jgi:hypothetical protein